MAGLYNGHLLEFPQIRVDCFTSPPASQSQPWMLPHPTNPYLSPRPAPPAQLYLLTHVHSDHLLGLSDNFTGHIICSPDTKRMLLRLEAESERGHIHSGLKERVKRKYEGLKRRVVDPGTKDERVVDRIEAVPYGHPREYDLGYEEGKPRRVTITLLDANHCPGSSMFLIASSKYAVLHTGDIRADDLFLKVLRRNPALSEFILPWTTPPSIKGKENAGRRILDRIYLDTGAVLGTSDMPDKELVLRDLIDQMSLYPEDTIFFLNVWCFGWEDVVKEVARNFDALIHVDRYKRSIYSSIQSDPFLAACTTTDCHYTRFHACERRAKCEVCRTFDKSGQRVWNRDKRIVHVNMVEIKSAGWDIERQVFLEKLGRAAIGEGTWPLSIDCPIARHSPLPELQALVKMFQPRSLSPNTMVSQVNGLDYYLLPDLFRDSLSKQGHKILVLERDIWFESSPRYGKEYLDNMARMKEIDLNLIPDTKLPLRTHGHLEQSDDKPNSQALGRGRRNHAMEQISRAGGLPKLTPNDISSILHLMAETGGVQPGLGFGGSTAEKAMVKMLVEKDSGGGFVALNYRSRKDDEDYDTEEDEERSRRKRRRPVLEDSQASDVDEAKPLLDVVRPAVHQLLGSMSNVSAEKPVIEVKEESSALPYVKVERRSMTPSARPRSRFSVNRNHLRALAQVCADVDDL